MRLSVGYGRGELIAHLVTKFTDGMTVEALMQGDIHIDHDIPMFWFDTKDPDQLRFLWRLDNVQPLWASDNLRKGARTNERWSEATL